MGNKNLVMIGVSSGGPIALRRRFVGAVTIVLTVLAGLLIWHGSREYQMLIASAEKRSASYASALKEHAERVFAEANTTLQDLTGEIATHGGAAYALSPQFHHQLGAMLNKRPRFSSIYVVDKSGTIIAHSQQYPMQAVNLADRDYFRYHRDTPDAGMYISKPFISRVSGTWRFSISRPLLDTVGRFNGLVSVTFETSYFQKFYETIDTGAHGRIILSTTRGDILVHEPFSEKALLADFKQAQLFKKYLPHASSGTYQTDSALISRMPRIISYNKLENFPVLSVISLDRSEIVALWLNVIYVQGIVFTLLCIFIVVLAVLFLRQLRRIEQTTIQLEANQAELVATSDQVMAMADEWRGTFDAVEDAVWVLNRERLIVHANRASQRIFGKSAHESVGLHCCQVVYENVVPKDTCPFELMLQTMKRASVQLIRDDHWYEISVDPIFAASGEIMQAVFIAKDIDRLKKSERREHDRSVILERIACDEPLPELLEFIARTVEKELPGALCAIMTVSEDGKRLLSCAAPSLPESYSRAVNRTRIGEGIGSCGTAAFRQERVVVEDLDTDPFWQGFTPAQEAGLRSCWSEPIVSSGNTVLGTFAIYHKQPAKPGDDEISLIRQAAAFAGIALERRQSEIERATLELKLGQSQKMEAIGQLAGGVAHDFNNLLTPIIVYADLLKRGLTGDEKMLPKVEGIIKASHKARDLTQQLLSFGRKQVLQVQLIDLNEVISSFQSIMRRTLRESIEIKLQLSASPAVISADRSKIDQIILNLAINAQDAIVNTGEVVLETGQVMIDDEYARLHPGLNAGRYVLLAFKDSGSGMNAEVQRHIFEPFYTTKQVGHGTGLGLANVYGIVKQHHGYIAVQSTIGVGTTFSIYLPQVDGLPDISGQDTIEDITDSVGDETILLVEDNDMVRAMTADLLLGLGYRVHVAAHPEEALELIKQYPGNIDLLITDVVMPGMNGLQLFEKIYAERPDINKVLYMSGYPNDVILNAGVLEEGIHFIPKPFTVEALVAKVRGLLQKSCGHGGTKGN